MRSIQRGLGAKNNDKRIQKRPKENNEVRKKIPVNFEEVKANFYGK